MSRVKLCTVASATIMLVCLFAMGIDSATLVQSPTAGNPIKVHAKRITSSPDGMKAENATLSTTDGRLEAKADSILVRKAQTPGSGAPLRGIDLTGKVSAVSITLALKGEPKIEASAAKAHIDLQAQVVELEGDVSVTTFRSVSGKLVPNTIRGSSAVILMTEKLGKGQERVQVPPPGPKPGTEDSRR